MHESPRERAATHIIIIGLAACWLMSRNELAAQSAAPRVLVVVANASDAECAKRLGCEHIDVELLFAPETGAVPGNYEACDERVRGLLAFSLFVFRADTCCPCEGFWRERMAAANPCGNLHRLSQSRPSAATDHERRVQQASDLHGALVSILPEHRASLDANLKAELHRLRSLRLHPLQLALGK